MGGKVLLIAEKESLAKQIASAFGISKISDKGKYFENDEVIVGIASGHLYQLKPKSKIDEIPYLPEYYDLQYEKVESKLHLINTLTRLLQRSDIQEVCNACDPGREGELIGAIIIENADFSFNKQSRLWASSQAPAAILDAYNNRKDATEYLNLRKAAKLRAIGDLVYGINASRAVTQLYRKKTGSKDTFSAGRVQTPTLALVVNRENEIKQFVAQPFWQVFLDIQVDGGNNRFIWMNPELVVKHNANEGGTEAEDDEAVEDKTEFNTNATRILTLAEAEVIKNQILNQNIKFEDFEINTHSNSVPPPLLFDGTALQGVADKLLDFDLSKTMSVLQTLYDAGYVTYPRSESTALAKDDKAAVLNAFKMLSNHRTFSDLARNVIQNNEAWVNTDNARNFIDRDKLVDGHGAIIPTDVPVIDTLTPDQDALYNLIVKRFIAAFYPAAEYQVTEQRLTLNDQCFMCKGSVLISKGWKEILEPVHLSKEEIINPITPASSLSTKEVIIKESKTKPPLRYTEGRLSAAMKRLGLGTVATREPIVRGLKGQAVKASKAAYLMREGKFIAPTDVGYSLIEYLHNNGLSLVCAPEFTSKFEEQLGLLTKGEVSEHDARDFIYQQAITVVNTLNNEVSKTPSFEEKLGTCPNCTGTVLDTGSMKCGCNSCNFALYKKISGCALTNEHLKELLGDTKKTKDSLKFYSEKNKRHFEAKLKLECKDGQWAVSFEFENKTYGQCPQCKSGTVQSKNANRLACEAACGFELYREMYGYKLPDAQLNKLISVGKTDLITQFYSASKNKNYSAYLVLAPGNEGNLKASLEFANKK